MAQYGSGLVDLSAVNLRESGLADCLKAYASHEFFCFDDFNPRVPN